MREGHQNITFTSVWLNNKLSSKEQVNKLVGFQNMLLFIGIVMASVVHLSQQDLPRIYVGPKDQTTVEGKSLSLTFYVQSQSKLKLSCLKNCKAFLPDLTRMSVSQSSSGGNSSTITFTINNVSRYDSGSYFCQVTSSNGRSQWYQVSLHVKIPVQVDMDITSQNMEFSSQLNDKSSPLFKKLSSTFEREISKIYENITEFKEVQVLGFTNGSVRVAYRVVLEVLGSKTNEPPPDVKQGVVRTTIEELKKKNGNIGTLRLKPESLNSSRVPPPAPRNLKKKEIKFKQIWITWEKPEYHGYYSITGYEIQYKEFDKGWNNILVRGKDVNDFAIDDLKQHGYYTIRVVSVNDGGKGPPSNRLEVITKLDNIVLFIFNMYKMEIIGGAIGLVLLFFMSILICCCCCCRKSTSTKKRRQNTKRRRDGDFSVLPDKPKLKGNKVEMVQLVPKAKEIPRDQIMIGEELGSGQFGLVTRGYLKQDKMHCAIKMLKDGASNDSYRDLMNELDIMSSVEEHPNIINLIGACTKEGPLYVVMELAECGCLLDFLHENQMYEIGFRDKISILSEEERLKISLDVAKGIQHLARHKCVHRDLAARNVLLGTNMTAKLSDFGLARDVYEKGYYQQLSNMKKLPARWMSIEAIETLVATKESDIWSFGVLQWEIHTGGKMPFPGLSVKELLESLKKGTRLNQPIGCSDQMYAVMMNCWNSNPHKRPTIDHLITVLNDQLSRVVSSDGRNDQQSSSNA